MVIVTLSSGLRISETRGLQWKDIDWLAKTVTLERGVVKQDVDDVKTEDSARTMPLADGVVAVLTHWKQVSQFARPDDWIFASPWKLGRQPVCYSWIWENLSIAGKTAGIGHLSSHAFRNAYRTWLDALGTPVGVQQKMMRHADIRTTMNYGDAMTDDMKEAGQKMAKMASGKPWARFQRVSKQAKCPKFWGGRRESNPQRPEPQSGALPVELLPPRTCDYNNSGEVP